MAIAARWKMRHPAALVSALLSAPALACSDFLLNASLPSNVLSARTMDFAVDLQTVVEIIPRGTWMQEPPVTDCRECEDLRWQTTYGFVALNMYGWNIAADGMNERGLSAAWLELDATEYPPIPHGRAHPTDTAPAEDSSLPIVTSVCSYLLGNFATVEEVRRGLDAIQIGEMDSTPFLDVASLRHSPLHVSVRDAAGNNLVIEFLHGKTTVYDNLNEVLTNDPPLSEQLIALARNGLEQVPGGYTSSERFLRLSVLNHRAAAGYTTAPSDASYLQASPEQAGVADALHLLNTVVRPPGVLPTEWSIVRDHQRLRLYVQSTMNQALRRIDLTQINFARATSRHALPITYGDWFIDLTRALVDPSSEFKTLDLPPRSLARTRAGDRAASAVSFAPPTIPAAMRAPSDDLPPYPWRMFLHGLLCGIALTSGVVLLALRGRKRAIAYQRIPDASASSRSTTFVDLH